MGTIKNQLTSVETIKSKAQSHNIRYALRESSSRRSVHAWVQSLKLILICSVYARVRPLACDVPRGDWCVEESSIAQRRNSTNKAYQLDRVFGDNASTEQVYQSTTRPFISNVLEGFNCTVFAYGQTSSGKTHTMRGSASDQGVIGRAVADLFSGIQQISKERQFSVRVSYMEVRTMWSTCLGQWACTAYEHETYPANYRLITSITCIHKL
jgi:hypothetical protein